MANIRILKNKWYTGVLTRNYGHLFAGDRVKFRFYEFDFWWATIEDNEDDYEANRPHWETVDIADGAQVNSVNQPPIKLDNIHRNTVQRGTFKGVI